ncbi:MAG: hypothetical protein HW384_1283 [Dehalococcoidia bacterium]|nr:hypothetical protein [Dehalococcoidia bacterium]MBF8304289.1 hypothetical protein [Dehalococcoidia bacterium]
MSDTIKSAYERALERAEKIVIPEDKLKELQHLPEGARLAATFLKEDKFDLLKAIAGFSEDVRKYIYKGAQEAFLSNIVLPRTPRSKTETKKAMDGLIAMKKDKSKLTQVIGKIDSLIAYYERTKQQAYDNLKKEFEAALRQAVQQQQIGMRQQNGKVDAEMQGEFQMKWREVSSRLDMDFENNLSGLKKEVERIS